MKSTVDVANYHKEVDIAKKAKERAEKETKIKFNRECRKVWIE